ncbi:uncharacterized protein LOC110939298 [Helianthus annuus]|uniref:uncharacterized protein LOC110939298 n=1 Tax=Helianthus annuus TaxID=4232 RepID=UPI000B900DB8|nr:uncharacterized protein LOC110939298 [Helianthus annuus]
MIKMTGVTSDVKSAIERRKQLWSLRRLKTVLRNPSLNRFWFAHILNVLKRFVSATPIFRIPIRVQDSAAIASLTLFDHEARKMLGMTAIQLLEKSKQEHASS